MSLSNKNIWTLPVILILVMWIGGCSTQNEPKELWDGQLYLCLNVYTAGPVQPNTRDNETYFQQPELDTEKMHTLRVIIVDDDKTILNSDKPNPFYNQIVHNKMRNFPQANVISKDDPELKYAVDFSKNYRVYLIANEDGIPNYDKDMFEKTLKKGNFYPAENLLENIPLDAVVAGSPILNNETLPIGVAPKRIPMTEIFKVRTKDQPEDPNIENLTQVEEMFVTRAYSKFSFIIKAAGNLNSGDYHHLFRYIRISGLTSKEFLFPKATYEDKTIDNIPGKFITEFSMPDDNSAPGSYTFELPKMIDITTEKNDYPYYPQIYFTESKGYVRSSDIGEFKCSISQTTEEDDFLDAVTLPNLSSLPRNTHVQIIITVSPHSIYADVTVLPYTGVNLNPIFGIDKDIVSLDRTDVTIEKDKQFSLSAAIEGTDQKLTWSISSNDDAVTFDKNSESPETDNPGTKTFNANKEGEATITVTSSNGKWATCLVTVIENEEDSGSEDDNN